MAMTEKRTASSVASAGLGICLTLQGVQTFVFAPLAGANVPFLLAAIALLSFGVTLSVLSFSNRQFAAVAGAVLYVLSFTLLWWHFVCRGTFSRPDFNWFELPALMIGLCLCVRAAVASPKPLQR